MSNKAYYRRKMKEYRKAKNELEDYKEELDRYLDKCQAEFHTFSNVYETTYNLQGEVMDNFNYESEAFSREIDQMLSKIEDDISIVNNKKNKAHDLYVKYRELYEHACRHHDDD